MRLAFAAAAAALAIAGGAQAATNLVQNGDFENYTLSPAQQSQTTGYVGFQVTYPGGSYAGAVDHWSSSQGGSFGSAYNLYFYNGNTATSGDAFSQYPGEQQRPNSNYVPLSPTSGGFMILDGDPSFTGPLSQTINGLVVGQTYTLGFWYADGELSNRNGFISEQLTGCFGGVMTPGGGCVGGDGFSTPTFFNSPSKAYGFNNPSGVPGDFSGWQHVSIKFTAHSTSQLLSFLAVGSPSNNLPPVSFLDGVTLTGAPEPELWAMMIVGFGGLGALARRRRARSAAV